MAVLLRLGQGICAAVDLLEAIDESPGEAKERIRPPRSQLCRFAKGRYGFCEFLLRGDLLSRLFGLAVDAMEVPLRISQRRLQTLIIRCGGNRACQRSSRSTP